MTDSRMVEQCRDREEIEHSQRVDNAPDARVGSHEERISTLQEAVHNEEEGNANGRCLCGVFWVIAILCKPLKSTKRNGEVLRLSHAKITS